MEKLSLGREFPQPSHEDWLGLVEKTLKGADFDTRLVSHTYEGLRIEPLYYEGNRDAAEPGQAPFRRGVSAASTAPTLCQSFAHPNLGQTNAEILEDIANGVSAIRLKIDDGDSGGIALRTPADLERVLEGVYLDMIPVEIDAGTRTGEIAGFLASLWQNRGLAGKAEGAFLNDPVNNGTDDIENAFRLAMETTANLPGVTALCADMRKIHLDGASDAQELAIAAATGLGFLRGLEKQGVALEEAAKQITFLLNVDADVFLSIAKLRSFREIWACITNACGIDPQPANIKAETAIRMMAGRDVHVNILRTTTACFAASVAGAQSITIAPYTQALGLPDGFGRRIARNTQIVLSEESGLGNVLDAAGGSWFIENLTDQLTDKAWDFFQQIETKGGIISALKSDFIANAIANIALQRNEDISTRKHGIIGLSEFANVLEEPVDFIEFPSSSNSSGHALGHAFEALRLASDRHVEKTGERPRIFLCNLGQASDFNQRSTFAANFFAAGGIEPLSNAGFETSEAAARAFTQSGARIAVICSNDITTQKIGVATAHALKVAGAEFVYHAGAGGELKADLVTAGVDDFITQGMDLVATLTQTHALLGVSSDE